MGGLLSTHDILSGDFQSSSMIFGTILDNKNSSGIVKVFCGIVKVFYVILLNALGRLLVIKK